MVISTLLASFLETGSQLLASPVYVVGAIGAMVGAVCLILGSLVKTMIPLRWLALSSNLGFIAFSIAEASVLNALVQLGLFGINIFRLAEMKQLTRRVAEASMTADLSGLWLRP
jgi:CRP/FNR family transcriptional regulator, cyclic AMP receptor protein